MTQEAPWKRYLFLGALFFCSFLLPVWVVSLFLRDSSSSVANVDQDPLFPDSIPVKTRGAFFTVQDNPGISAIEGSDYLFFGWFKFDTLPQEEKEAVLVSKIDQSRGTRPGFSIQILRKGESFRPSVYWKNNEGKGGRYEFEDFKLSVSVWYAFVLSYQQPNTLGFHFVSIKEGEKPITTLLGGYKLKIPVYAASNVRLQIGAPQLGTFRGSIGPVGVISGKNILEDMRGILKELSKNPLGIESFFDKNDIKFLTTDGVNDVGSQHLIINQSTKLNS